MGFLYVYLALLLCMVVLFLTPLRIRIQYLPEETDALHLCFQIGPFVLLRLPEKKKPVRLRDFTYAKHQKRLAREKIQAEKEARKKQNKPMSAKKKLEGAMGEKKENPLEKILTVLRTLCQILPPLFHEMHCRIQRLEVVVGREDVAEIAVYYGIFSQSLAYLLEFLTEQTHFTPPDIEHAFVRADFLSKKVTVTADIGLQLRLGSIVWTLMRHTPKMLLRKPQSKKK